MVARLSFLFSVKNMVSSANRASLVLWLVVKSVVGGRKVLWDSREVWSGRRKVVFYFSIERTVREEGFNDFDDFSREVEGR